MNIFPLATISAGGMMMETLGKPGKMGMGTREVGDMIAKLVS